MNKLESLKQLLAVRKVGNTTTDGIFSGTGLVALNLEPQIKSLVPYLYPFRSSLPRVTSAVGGLAVNWRSVLGVNPGNLSIPEANRNAETRFQEFDNSAAYKNFGTETEVGMFAQEAGRSFDDALGFAQFSGLQSHLAAEEKQLLYGNSGPSGNGYQIAAPVAPVATANTSPAGSFTEASLYVFCVAITPTGMSLQNGIVDASTEGGFAGKGGLTTIFTKTSADGSSLTYAGGISAVSVASNNAAPSSANSVVATVTPVVGAVGYAWYVNIAAGTTAAAKFHSITVYPSVTITAANLPAADAQTAADTGLNRALTDSYNALDVDGIMSWCIKWASAPSGATGFNAYYNDLAGASLTAVGDGTISEFNDVADYLWNNFKLAPDKIWVGGNLIRRVTQATLAGTSGAGSGAQRIIFEQNNMGQVAGGAVVASYRWPYSYSGGPKVVDIETLPALPAGCILFQLQNCPYPSAAGKVPTAFRVNCLKDVFSIQWPYRKLQTEVGIYSFEATQNYLPFGQALIVGAK